jgi:D-aminoacyl-tRNA deacylase
MRAVVQRVSEASVSVDGTVVGRIERGLLVFLGVGEGDTAREAETMANKVTGLRCFEDDDSKFNLALQDVQGSVLAISQFTLFGDCRKGKRPSFIEAARPELAIPLYEAFVTHLRDSGLKVETGRFGAHMVVSSVNDGPVTLLIDSQKLF